MIVAVGETSLFNLHDIQSASLRGHELIIQLRHAAAPQEIAFTRWIEDPTQRDGGFHDADYDGAKAAFHQLSIDLEEGVNQNRGKLLTE